MLKNRANLQILKHFTEQDLTNILVMDIISIVGLMFRAKGKLTALQHKGFDNVSNSTENSNHGRIRRI